MYTHAHAMNPYMGPKIVLESLTLLFRIQEVPGSNLGLETFYPDRFL
jgi:hypothetical protein